MSSPRLDGEKGKESADIELQKTLEKKFNLIFPKPLIDKLGKGNEEIIGRIKGQFLINGGNLDPALDNAIGIQSGGAESPPSGSELTGGLHLSLVERKKLKELILNLIQSLQKTDSKEVTPQVHQTEKAPREGEQTSFDELEPYQKLPEYDMMKRLAQQGYIPETRLDILSKTGIKKDSASIKRYYTELLQDPEIGLDEKMKATMLERINGVSKKMDEPEKVAKSEFTEQDFQNSEFLKDFKVAIPGEHLELSPFTQFLAENHISIPAKGRKESEKPSNNSVEDINATFSSCTKKIITEQDPTFNSINKVDIDIVLKEKGDLKLKFSALERLFTASNILNAEKNLSSQGGIQKIEGIQKLLKISRDNFSESTLKYTKKQPIRRKIEQLEGMLPGTGESIDNALQDKINLIIDKGNAILAGIDKGENIDDKLIEFNKEADARLKITPI